MGWSGEAVDVYTDAGKELRSRAGLTLKGRLLIELDMQLSIFVFHIFPEAATMVQAARWRLSFRHIVTATGVTHCKRLVR